MIKTKFYCVTLSSESDSFSEYSSWDNFSLLLIESSITPHFQKNRQWASLQKEASRLYKGVLDYSSFILILVSIDKHLNTFFQPYPKCLFLVDRTSHTYSSLHTLSDLHNDLLNPGPPIICWAYSLPLPCWPHPPLQYLLGFPNTVASFSSTSGVFLCSLLHSYLLSWLLL